MSEVGKAKGNILCDAYLSPSKGESIKDCVSVPQL